MGYFEMVLEDVKQYCEDNSDYFDFSAYADKDEFEQELQDNLWTEDSVTGNASGSYTFNTAEAKEIVLENMEDVVEAMKEFGQVDEIGEKMANDEWEFLDVSARCYFLSQAISQYCEDNEEAIEKAIEEAHEEE